MSCEDLPDSSAGCARHGGLPEMLPAEVPDPEWYAEWLDSFYARDVQELFGIRAAAISWRRRAWKRRTTCGPVRSWRRVRGCLSSPSWMKMLIGVSIVTETARQKTSRRPTPWWARRSRVP